MTLFEQILLSIITALITAGFAYLGFWRQAKAELKKEFQNKFNNRKWDAYQEFIDQISLMRLMSSKFYGVLKENQKEEYFKLDDQLYRNLDQVESEILLVGSNIVVSAYIKWRREFLGTTYDNAETFKAMIELLNSMRVDLGLEKSDINYQLFDPYVIRIDQS